ncbi:MAG: hypothetical protein JWN27_2924 [Candidatus Eremiobacteraeota bacterium]|nr:hypothetical protein [Candidatus Eremiobacteraeota bacterium]
MLVRMPVGVRRAIAEAAHAEPSNRQRSRSMNAWIVEKLAIAAGMQPQPVTVVVGHRWRATAGSEKKHAVD